MIHAYVIPTTPKVKQHYDVLVSGDVEPIVAGSVDPEYDACRMLAARGAEGPIRFYLVSKEDGTQPVESFEYLCPSLTFKDLGPPRSAPSRPRERGLVRVAGVPSSCVVRSSPLSPGC
jgi:hypothetical protein